MNSMRTPSGSTILIFALCTAGTLRAQDATQSTEAEADSTAQLTEIVVTAQRREENIQRAALAITAVSGDQLEKNGIGSAQELSQLTAGLQVTPSGGPYISFTVRSVTSLAGNAFSDPAVALNVNGVYLAMA